MAIQSKGKKIGAVYFGILSIGKVYRGSSPAHTGK